MWFRVSDEQHGSRQHGGGASSFAISLQFDPELRVLSVLSIALHVGHVSFL